MYVDDEELEDPVMSYHGGSSVGAGHLQMQFEQEQNLELHDDTNGDRSEGPSRCVKPDVSDFHVMFFFLSCKSM